MTNSNPPNHNTSQDNELAADVIRQKIAGIYKVEPDAKEEVKVAETTEHRSKHQRFMHELTTSGKSLADIQTAWHEYYQQLSDEDKHQVWQEFYSAHNAVSQTAQTSHHPAGQPVAPMLHHKAPAQPKSYGKKRLASQATTVGELKDRIARKATSSTKLSKKQHVQSLLFGFGMGAIVLLIMLFWFFQRTLYCAIYYPKQSRQQHAYYS
jgi:hypothetical protein